MYTTKVFRADGIIEEELYEDAVLGKYNARIRRDIVDEEEERSASIPFEQDDVEESTQILQDVNEDRPGHGSHCRKHHKVLYCNAYSTYTCVRTIIVGIHCILR